MYWGAQEEALHFAMQIAHVQTALLHNYQSYAKVRAVRRTMLELHV
jgi:hypothetical protein